VVLVLTLCFFCSSFVLLLFFFCSSFVHLLFIFLRTAILDTQGDCMQVFSGHSGPVTCGGFSSDGKFVVTASVDGTAKVWNPKNGKCRHSFGNVGKQTSWHDQHVGGILSLAISADCTTIVTGKTRSPLTTTGHNLTY